MKLRSTLVIALAATSLALVGCASDSANTYTRSQAMRTSTAQAGIVESVRNVRIQNDTNAIGTIAGGVIGGAAGSQIGGGNGAIVAGVLGAIAGGVAGNQIEKNSSTQAALEITVRLDNGQRLVITQAADMSFSAGQRVDVISDGQTSRVVPVQR
ncbi:glycine zipper 2TM domain-containing protein [Silvimonas sp.]|uniref:glycine zipper 2TM domain-containing protein n=1 Tax=Silvimonas sp. TaxID=2650811 RepID=UPI00283D6326|nr:glycine zipper 2TM domain-containing protein [Silvimonas sp.]MDR3425855.1 glycine zipper 2TM domain-containing protein [Silvimonas sp.]